MSFETIQALRNGSRVRRYHTMDLIKDETVGHHSANVAMICAILSDGAPSVNLLLSALTHDLAEQHTGDVPATAKWASLRLKEALDELEGQYSFIGLPQALTHEEKRILKQADMLDLCFKCLDEMSLGNAGVVAMLERGLNWLRDHDPLPQTREIMKEIEDEC